MKTSTLALAACGTAFIGYCIYFDKKRRSHPDFKKNLLERRKAEKSRSDTKSSKVVFPDLRNVEEVQKFFLEQVQKGEECMANGQIEEGVDYLTNAVAVCGQPQQLLSVLQNTLPREVFQMLAANLSTISERLATSPTMSGMKMPGGGAGDSSTPKIQEIVESAPQKPPALSGGSPTAEESANIIDVDELE